MEFIADSMCFACGATNPHGLHLTFRQEPDGYATTFTADPAYQGYHGIVHGGVMATVLDEIMARYVWVLHGPAATARMEIRYRRPAPVEQPIEIRGWITAERRGGRAFETAARAFLPGGDVLAEATGLIVRLDLRAKDTSCTP